jgi:hypothetical protein
MDHEIDKQDARSTEGGQVKAGSEASCPSLAIGQQVKVVCHRHSHDGRRGVIIGFCGIKQGEAIYEVRIDGEAIAVILRRNSLAKVEANYEDMHVGDKVWVLCEVEEALPDGLQVKGCYGGIPIWALADDCRPVEPEVKEPTRGR